jgi:ATP-dependent Zn protease
VPLRLPLRARPQVKALLARNRACLDALVELLLEKEQVQGEEVRALVEAQAHPDDLAFRAQAKEAALL